MTTHLYSQNLSKHKWKERVFLIISEDSGTEELPVPYIKQLDELEPHLEGFIERKIVVYTIFPNKFRCINPIKHEESDWILSSKLFETYNPEKAEFKVILIGLDGSIKAIRTELFPASELFAIIDRMPMRRAEIKAGN